MYKYIYIYMYHMKPNSVIKDILNYFLCISYYSICPERYKVGVIKSYIPSELNLSFHVSSDGNIFF